MTDLVTLMIARDEGTLTEEQEDELAQAILDTEFYKSVGWAGRFVRDKLDQGWTPRGCEDVAAWWRRT